MERLSTPRLAPKVSLRSRWQSQQQSQSQQPQHLSSESASTGTGKLVRSPSVMMEERENLVDVVFETCFVGKLNGGAWWRVDANFNRCTSCPWRPFCLKFGAARSHSLLFEVWCLSAPAVRISAGGVVVALRKQVASVAQVHPQC